MSTAAALFSVAILLTLVFAKPFAGPYEIIFKRFYLCDNTGDNTIIFGTKLSKINRTTLSYTTNMTFSRGLSNNMQAAIDFSVFGNGGWKKNYFHIKLDHACSEALKMFPELLESLLASAGYNLTKCPIPPGSYYLKNWLFSIKMAMKIMPYNTYKVDVTAYENGRIQTCFTLEVDFVPK